MGVAKKKDKQTLNVKEPNSPNIEHVCILIFEIIPTLTSKMRFS